MNLCTCIWTKKQFLHLLDLTTLTSWVRLSSCGAKISSRHLHLLMVRSITDAAGALGCLYPLIKICSSYTGKNAHSLALKKMITGLQTATGWDVLHVLLMVYIYKQSISLWNVNKHCVFYVLKRSTLNLQCEQFQSTRNMDTNLATLQ